MRILSVDDDEWNQLLMEHLLVRQGHSVATALNGAEAVLAFESGRFDLILMDLHMPVMDGLDATRAIRRVEAAHAGAALTPIIAVTASDCRRDCFAAGMDAVVAKPIDTSYLLALITQTVSGLSSKPPLDERAA